MDALKIVSVTPPLGPVVKCVTSSELCAVIVSLESELEGTSDVPMEGSKEGSGLVAFVHVRPCVLRLGRKREEVTARCLEGKVSRERRDPLELRTELVEESGVEGRALLGVCRGR